MTDHDAIATTCRNLGTVYFLMCDYLSALQNYEIASRSLQSDHPHVIQYRNHIATTTRHIQYLEKKNISSFFYKNLYCS